MKTRLVDLDRFVSAMVLAIMMLVSQTEPSSTTSVQPSHGVFC